MRRLCDPVLFQKGVGELRPLEAVLCGTINREVEFGREAAADEEWRVVGDGQGDLIWMTSSGRQRC